jgi:hypothetical protein
MSSAASTIRFYSFYLFLMGAGMVLVPNLLLGILGFHPTSEIWIRVLGLFTFTVGIYYYHSARHEQIEFFRATTIGRLFFFLATVGLVFVFNQSVMLAAIGSIDLLGALWTYAAIKNYKSS